MNTCLNSEYRCSEILKLQVPSAWYILSYAQLAEIRNSDIQISELILASFNASAINVQMAGYE